MALEVIGLDRIFKKITNGEDIYFDDPNPMFDVDEVLSFYANQDPELTNATIHGPEVEHDKVVYSFKSTVGVKG